MIRIINATVRMVASVVLVVAPKIKVTTEILNWGDTVTMDLRQPYFAADYVVDPNDYARTIITYTA